MTKHTPGKIQADFENGQILSSRFDPDSGTYAHICDGVSDENASRIVHTWNCHDELVEALEWALAEINAKTKYSTETQFGDCLAKATSQLSKAKGE